MRDDRVRLGDILEAIERIEKYAGQGSEGLSSIKSPPKVFFFDCAFSGIIALPSDSGEADWIGHFLGWGTILAMMYVSLSILK